MKNTQHAYEITEEVLDYPGEIIALSTDFKQVLGHGRTASEAAEMATRAGAERYIFYRASVNPGTIVI